VIVYTGMAAVNRNRRNLTLNKFRYI
jgi:hypothetical protein